MFLISAENVFSVVTECGRGVAFEQFALVSADLCMSIAKDKEGNGIKQGAKELNGWGILLERLEDLRATFRAAEPAEVC